jgi:hypothetical protein
LKKGNHFQSGFPVDDLGLYPSIIEEKGGSLRAADEEANGDSIGDCPKEPIILVG